MHYQWQSPRSLLKDIEIYRPHQKQEAVLYAPAGIAPEKLQLIPEILQRYHLVAEPDIQGEAYVLRVKNFGTRQQLLGILEREGLTEGPHSETKTELDIQKKSGISTVRLAGGIHFCTDVSLIVAGWLRGKTGIGDTLAGLKWAAVGLLLAVFGSKDADKQVGYIYQDMSAKLKKIGVELNDTDRATIEALAEKPGGLRSLERLVRENPIIINNVITAWGGLDMVYAGYKQVSPTTGQRNHYKMIAGSLTAAGQTAGITIPPKKKNLDDEEQKLDADGNPIKEPDHRGVVERVKDFYHEKPLRITGQASMLSNGFRMLSGWTEMVRNKLFLSEEYPAELARLKEMGESGLQDLQALEVTRANINRTVTSAKIDLYANVAKMVANACYALSDTNIDADLKQLGLLDEIGNTVAHAIHHQPASVSRPEMITKISAELCKQCGEKVSAKMIAQVISDKLDAISRNPWEKAYPDAKVNHAAPQGPLQGDPATSQYIS